MSESGNGEGGGEGEIAPARAPSPHLAARESAEDDLDPLAEHDDSAFDAPPSPTIFVTDPTVEAARVEWALRARGYNVIDVPLAMLAGRVTVQRPHLVLLDVDAPGALEIAARVRQLPGASGVHLIYAGVAGKTFESARDAFAHEGSGFFARPVDIDGLVTKIDSLLGIESPSDTSGGPTSGRPHRSSRPPPPPPSLRAPASPIPPRPISDAPREGLPIVAPMSFSREGGRAPSEPPPSEPIRPQRAWPNRSAETRLSPDLERLLREAEARVGGPPSQRSPESVPSSDEELLSPEDEVEAVLPAEILASLDEPLDAEVDDEEGGSSETGGTPHAATTGAAQKTAGTSAGREQTHGGDAAPEVPQTTAGGRARAQTSAGARTGAEAIAPQSAQTIGGGTGVGSVGTMERAPETPQPSEVRRDITTPRPPRRVPQPEVEERAQSQVDHAHGMPAPAPEHAPPLAPQTSRPPAFRANAEPPPPPQPPVVQAAPEAMVQPRAITSADEALRSLASAVATRVTGVLRYDEANGIRRIVLQDGDVVTAASSVEGESLLGYLVGRGDLAADVAKRLEGRVPPFGRLAGAALVAHGHLHQDQLWDVLQAHAAWLLTRAVAIPRGRVAYEAEPPQRLRGEPPVFGGTPGPALVVEIVRRSVAPADAIARLGGLDVRFATGTNAKLVDECGLDDPDEELLRRANGSALRELIETSDDVPGLLYALVALGVLEGLAGIRPGVRAAEISPDEVELADPLRDAELDDGAIRARIGARRALAEDGDYFAILGVARDSNGYEIKRAYLDLRRALDPQRVMRPSLLDVADDLKIVLGVLDEAYDVLKDATRRERYRRAITHDPPAK